MLKKLVINNYAIIDHLVLEPDAHLNIITGETGAGKSIIIGAFSLILGERADTSVLINKEEKCVIEAYFDVAENRAFRNAIRGEELDDETQCIIRREISTAGKSRAFINDTPVNLQVLNRLTSLLVDLHQQFDNLSLEEDSFQMDVVDAMAQNGELRKKYEGLFCQYKKQKHDLAELQQKQKQFQRELDYKQFLLDELNHADFREEEIEQADQQLKQLTHAERILSVLQVAQRSLDEGEQPIVNELKRISQKLLGIADITPGVTELNERLNSVFAELKDIVSELELLQAKVNLDPKVMQYLQERIDLGYKLLRKHGFSTTKELLDFKEQLVNDLRVSSELDSSIEKLKREQEIVFSAVNEEAKKLSLARKKTIPALIEKVNSLLALVGMPNAKLQIIIEPGEPDVLGVDKIQFLLDANKSNRFLPIYKSASGGELSRIMLCVKSLTARAMEMPVLLFDEVDTGISGEAARQVGILLKDLAQHHQVVCITHQPQVAAKSSRHFYVYKEVDKTKRITTRVKQLDKNERVLVIAQMIGGESPSEAAMQNAKELVGAV
jgi:DNA repair protein RecN (Recombination protein N)